MATYRAQTPTSAGVPLDFKTSTNGDKVSPGSILIVKNTAASTATVTMVTPLLVDGDLAVVDRTSDTIPALTGLNAIKVPNNEVYRGADGLVTLNFSAPGATLTYAVIS